MSTPFVVRCAAIDPDAIVPGRFSDAGLAELAVALGGSADAEQPWEGVLQAIRSLPTQEMGERLLEAVLLKPPIPAGCEALLHAMRQVDSPPWIDHEVPEDRFQLWYCHLLVHRAFPDAWPAPAVRRVRLEVYQLDPAARAPGRRSPPRDRTAFFARLLQDRVGDNPIVARYGTDAGLPASWSYDVVWATQFGEQARVPPDEVPSLDGAQAPDASALRHSVEGWVAPHWLGDLAVGACWSSAAHIDPITSRA